MNRPDKIPAPLKAWEPALTEAELCVESAAGVAGQLHVARVPQQMASLQNSLGRAADLASQFPVLAGHIPEDHGLVGNAADAGGRAALRQRLTGLKNKVSLCQALLLQANRLFCKSECHLNTDSCYSATGASVPPPKSATVSLFG